MSAGGGVEIFHILGWVVTVGGVAINLVWNYKNRTHSNQLAFDIRTEAYRRECWERIRSRIDDCVDELLEVVSNAPAQVLAIPAGGKPSVFLDILNLNMVNAQDALARALQAADTSTDCNVLYWSAAACGASHGEETSWDLLLANFSTARDIGDIEEQVKKLKELKPYALEIHSAVSELIRRQDLVLRPST